MDHLGRMLRRGPREILLLGAIVLLPAVALALLAFRTFQGEQSREAYQHTERQQQILRLLGNDLSDLVQARCTEASKETIALEIQQNRILLPRLNVYLPVGDDHENATRLSTRDADLWREAQAAEFRHGNSSDAVQRYRRLAAGGSVVSSWAQLALLRLVLQRADFQNAEVWLKQIQAGDPRAATESGIPIRVAAAVLLVSRDDRALIPEAAGFLGQTLRQLVEGLWPLHAAQWIYYAEEMSRVPEVDAQLRADAVATAGLLASLGAVVPDVLSLNQDLEWRRAQPLVSRYLPGIRRVVVLVPGNGRNTGCLLPAAEIVQEAQTRLTALTAAEDFEGRVAVSGDGTQVDGVSVPAFAFLEASFPERDQTLWRSHLRRYAVFYAAILLLAGAAAGLVFTYRAVAREMELSRMKARFIASVSHEFRTPLSAIEALLERLESGKVQDKDMLGRYYQASRREVHRLTGMVNQLLNFSRLEEGREEFRFETIDLNAVAREAIESFVDLGSGARLRDELAEAASLNIRADRDAARQCIHNLIDNALKYSPPAAPVQIASGRSDGKVFLRVTDHGPGVAPREQALIFERFYRGGGANAGGVQGTGIGLALVRTVMAAHGGAVTLRSHAGEGSAFELTFPEAAS
jgi:signal transduction histidine kinase